MPRVLFTCPMDAERRTILAERNRGAFEAGGTRLLKSAIFDTEAP
jgi:hypothetical protein